MSENNAVAKSESPAPVVAGFGSSLSFDFMQRQAQMLASSALVPKEFSMADAKNPQEKATKIANVVIALEMANRIGASPLMIMQNLYIVHGKPSWSSTFIIAAINGCGRFTAMKFEKTGTGDDRTCIAVATEKNTGERLESPPVSIKMAKDEGWYSKSGSKWKTMPELMLCYRTATLFGRLYAPEILMGMRAVEEVEDIEDAEIVKQQSRAADIVSRFTTEAETAQTAETGELPISAEEAAEAGQAEQGSNPLLQECYQLLADLSALRAESPDDIIDTLTNHKIGCQQDLEGKSDAYLNDLKMQLENEKEKEA